MRTLKLLTVAVAIAASASAWAQSGQLGANQIWGNPTGSGAPSQSSNIGSFLTPGTGLSISGTPKATIGLVNQITAAGPSGSATQTPVLTYNAQGQLTVVTLATIAPPFSAVTGSLACSQEPALTGDTTSSAGSCATTTVKVNSVAFGTSPATNTIPIITAANTATYTALPNCTSGSLQYTTSTHLFSCGAAGTGTVTSAQLSAGSGISVATTAGANPCISTCNLTIANTGLVVIKKQTFTASGTYTPSTGLVYAIIECVGGGGGGGGAAAAASAANDGGGGGSGGWSRAIASAAAIGASQTVTIGAAGTAGTTAPTNGGTGGDTSVGALCIGKGGSGGVLSSGTVGSGGAGGVAGTGSVLTAIGEPGGSGSFANVVTVALVSGKGGSTPYGGGAASSATTGTGATANTGGGGSGGSVISSASALAGGAGGSGLVIVTEFTNQ